MTLPKAIQAQIEAADAQVEQMYGRQPDNTDTDNQNPEPQVDSKQPEANIPQVVQAPQPAVDEWKPRFDTLQGKYNAEIPRLNQQVRETQHALQTLLEENARLKASHREPVNNLVTDADREAFGTDLVDVMGRVAKEATQPLRQELDRLNNEKAQLEAQLGHVNSEVQVSAADRFQTKLTQLVPNWETVNQDQRFLLWLGEQDPVFGVQRQAALDAAAGRNDAAATAAVFTTWLNTVTPPQTPTNPRQELQNQVAPSRSRVAAAPTADDGATQIWTEAQISNFYTEARRGRFDQAEADRIEAQINRAVSEGRVRM